MGTAQAGSITAEKSDILATLAKHRWLLRNTLRDMTDEQAAARTTVSELCLGGLIKHVSAVEQRWAHFIVAGATVLSGASEEALAAHTESFRMLPGETVVDLLRAYAKVAEETDNLVAELPDLDRSHPLPEAPWFEPGASWSARRVLLHIIAETAQHAGHTDIIREAIDGAHSM